MCEGQSPVDAPTTTPACPKTGSRYVCPNSAQTGCVDGKPHWPAYGAGAFARGGAADADAANTSAIRRKSFFKRPTRDRSSKGGGSRRPLLHQPNDSERYDSLSSGESTSGTSSASRASGGSALTGPSPW